MSKRLEQFIRDNREQFDTDEPAPQVWKKLEQALSPTEKKQQGKVIAMKALRWSVAAAILVFAGLGVYSLVNDKGSTGNVVAENNSAPTSPDEILNSINPVYAQEVVHFTELIGTKQNELKQIEKENPDLYKQFITDINKLDSSYNALKKDLPVNPNREQLLDAMIQNLRLQTELLNQQLLIIQKINQTKKDRNENNSKSI